MSVSFPPSFSGPIDRIQSLEPVVLVPISSGPLNQQLGDVANVGRPSEFTELRVATPDAAVQAGVLLFEAGLRKLKPCHGEGFLYWTKDSKDDL